MAPTATIAQTVPVATLKATSLPDAPFGATIQMPEGVTDPSKLSDADFKVLFKALHENLVIVIPGQKELSPESQHLLTKRFDPTTEGNYGHSREFRHEKSVLKKDGKSVPRVPQVQILGQGTFQDHEGLDEVSLTHPIHDTFHKEILSQSKQDAGYTKFYRWHIDSALYGLSPPVCTTLLGIHVPNAANERQKILYEDSNEEIEIAQGATCFMSGARAFELLSEEDKKQALGTTVVYAPHPYIYISEAKATWDGISMHSEGKELSFDDLPEWETEKIKRLPLVWTNPVTGKHHLQAHGCCVWKLERENGEVLELEQARKELRRVLRPAISPKEILAFSWEAGDLVIFYNRGVLHSVTGHFAEGQKRLMHQCNIASGQDPICKV
ncbi:Clavaminate synthase-like protein [Nadsonia fulvescens var. elongata DSM 6958]|uniref:Clavaminate synthase-like protein n=1 Tax=Nadsonia fulvescens var. elongata DSM 6958 TaxID=857566 RepID=A0A1E3PHY9_9ASCO|nr:Clavaminate synthase-like protein [Nadsonia fulvescens var. elongata DSM 6958]